MSSISTIPSPRPSTPVTKVWAPLPKSPISSVKGVRHDAQKPAADRAPGQSVLPMAVSVTVCVVALAGVAACAIFFPPALAVAVPALLFAFGMASVKTRDMVEEIKAAHEPPAKRSYSPTPPAPISMNGGLIEGIKTPLRPDARRTAHARTYLAYLEQPGKYSPDLLIGPLAQARGYSVRLWEHAGGDEKSAVYESLDIDGRFHDLGDESKGTFNLVIDGAHFTTLQLLADKAPKREVWEDSTVRYELRGLPASGALQQPTNEHDAVERPNMANGDCLFHAWATAENYRNYNALAPEDKDGRTRLAQELRSIAVRAAGELIDAGDAHFIKELACHGREEFNAAWARAQEFINAAVTQNEPALRKNYGEVAAQQLVLCLDLLADHQQEARDAVMRRLYRVYSVWRSNQG